MGKSVFLLTGAERGTGSDLLAALAHGAAPTERLSDSDRASIAIESPVIRAIRRAATIERPRHLVLVGGPGEGKTFAARGAERQGFHSVELPSTGGPIEVLDDLARSTRQALEEGRRLLVTLNPADLSSWISVPGVDDSPLGVILRETSEDLGAKAEWTAQIDANAGVIDLSLVRVARREIVDALLQRTAVLALRCTADPGRAAASSALRNVSVRAWIHALIEDAEARRVRFSIGNLWRLAAFLACGGHLEREDTLFSLTDSVGARLFRYTLEGQSEPLFAALDPARTSTCATVLFPTLQRLAHLCGFEEPDSTTVVGGSAEDVARAEAVHAAAPPTPTRESQDYARAIAVLHKRSGWVDLRTLPGEVTQAVASLVTFTPVKADARSSAVPDERVLHFSGLANHAEAPLFVSAARPNPFAQRALAGDSVVPFMLVRQGIAPSIDLDLSLYELLATETSRERDDAILSHPAVRRWRGEHSEASPAGVGGARLESDLVRPCYDGVGERFPTRAAPADEVAHLHVDLSTSRPQVFVEDGRTRRASEVRRPLGLLTSLARRGLLGASASDGGGFRLASVIDLEGYATDRTLRADRVDPLVFTSMDSPPSEAICRFLEVRRELVDACSALVSWRGGDDLAPNDRAALAASIALEVSPREVFQRHPETVLKYLEAYQGLLAITVEHPIHDESTAALFNLDIAFRAQPGRARARMLPTHPLSVARSWSRYQRRVALEDEPAVIAIHQRRLIPLRRDGEVGFYHEGGGDSPTLDAVVEAARSMLRDQASVGDDRLMLDIDLVDIRFGAALLDALVDESERTLEIGGRPERRIAIRGRFVVTARGDGEDWRVPLVVELGAAARAAAASDESAVSLVWEASPRLLEETALAALTVTALIAPYGARALCSPALVEVPAAREVAGALIGAYRGLLSTHGLDPSANCLDAPIVSSASVMTFASRVNPCVDGIPFEHSRPVGRCVIGSIGGPSVDTTREGGAVSPHAPLDEVRPIVSAEDVLPRVAPLLLAAIEGTPATTEDGPPASANRGHWRRASDLEIATFKPSEAQIFPSLFERSNSLV